jgi:hypothetical protein
VFCLRYGNAVRRGPLQIPCEGRYRSLVLRHCRGSDGDGEQQPTTKNPSLQIRSACSLCGAYEIAESCRIWIAGATFSHVTACSGLGFSRGTPHRRGDESDVSRVRRGVLEHPVKAPAVRRHELPRRRRELRYLRPLPKPLPTPSGRPEYKGIDPTFNPQNPGL